MLFVFACGTSRKVENKTSAATYKRDVNTIHPEFTIFHVSDSLSELHYKISSKELLYTRPDGFNFSSNL